VFLEIENKLNLTTEKNRAMIIGNLADLWRLNPIEFIDNKVKRAA